MQRFVAILILTLAAGLAHAIDLHTAKEQGLVGERNDGYLDYVVTPPSDEIKALVQEINNKRKEKFAETAQEFDIASDQVAKRFYQRAVVESKSGHYIQDANGQWVKKP